MMWNINVATLLGVLLLLKLNERKHGVSATAECVYQYDMKNNRVKITCGQGAVLHVVDQHGNTLLTGETSTSADTPVVFQLNRYGQETLN